MWDLDFAKWFMNLERFWETLSDTQSLLAPPFSSSSGTDYFHLKKGLEDGFKAFYPKFSQASYFCMDCLVNFQIWSWDFEMTLFFRLRNQFRERCIICCFIFTRDANCLGCLWRRGHFVAKRWQNRSLKFCECFYCRANNATTMLQNGHYIK